MKKRGNDMKTGSRADANLMTEGDIRKKMLLFAIPVMLGNLFQQLYNTADSLIVGNFLGPQSLAAVASTGSLIYLIIGLFNGMSMGAGTVIARYIGARDDDFTERAVHTAIAVGLLFSVVISAGGYFLAEPLLRLMGSPEDVLPQSARYLSIYFGGSFSVIMYNMFVGILQASGDSRHPLIYLVISSVINILLDLLFIAVFGMGVEGAAFATILSQLFSAVAAGIRLSRTQGAIRFRPSRIRFDGDSLRQILRYGVPTGAQSCVIDLSNVLIQSFVNSFGSAVMAGFGAYSKIEGFTFLPVGAFQMALATFVSQNIGAGEHERARKGILFGVGTGAVLSEVIGILVVIFARPILGIFGNDADVIKYGMLRAVICAPFMLLPAYAHTMSATMRGIGKPMAPMVILLSCWCAVRVFLLFTVGRVWHNVLLLCWIYPFTWTISTVVYTIYAFRLRKEFPWLKIRN